MEKNVCHHGDGFCEKRKSEEVVVGKYSKDK